MAHPYQNQKYREHHPGRAAAKRILKAEGGEIVERQGSVNREARGDKEPKAGDRYGGADLPISKPGTNERAFYDVRKDK